AGAAAAAGGRILGTRRDPHGSGRAPGKLGPSRLVASASREFWNSAISMTLIPCATAGRPAQQCSSTTPFTVDKSTAEPKRFSSDTPPCPATVCDDGVIPLSL